MITPETPEQMATLRAAVRAKLGLPCRMKDLIRGLPKNHAVQFTLADIADFVLRQFACEQSETEVLIRKKFQLGDE